MLRKHLPRFSAPVSRNRLLCLVVLTVLAWLSGPGARVSQAQTHSVVVLDLTVAPGLAPALGDKVRNVLAGELSRLGGFRVVPRQRVEDEVAANVALILCSNPRTGDLVRQIFIPQPRIGSIKAN